jgi:predicted PurR-regulated permease PerM
MRPSEEWRREAVAWLLAAGLGFLVYLVIRPFLTAMLWAGVLVVFFYPGHRWLLARIARPRAAALASTAVVAVLLAAPIAWLAPAFVEQSIDTVGQLPSQTIMERLDAAASWISEKAPSAAFEVEDVVRDAVRGIRGRIGEWSARLAGNLAAFVVDAIVLLLGLFYLFLDGARLVDLLRDISPFGGERHDRMMAETMDMISATIRAGLVVAAAQGILGGLTFAVLGLPSPVFWGVVIAFLSLVPILGAWMVWLPAGVGLLLSGDVTRGAALLITGLVLISTIDNVLRPILIAGRSQLNGLLVFVSVLGGMQVFGFIGLVLGPLTVATAVGLIRGYRESLKNGATEPATDVNAV